MGGSRERVGSGNGTEDSRTPVRWPTTTVPSRTSRSSRGARLNPGAASATMVSPLGVLMQLRILHKECCGNGLCREIAPGAFGVDSKNKATDPGPGVRDPGEDPRGCRDCPARRIEVLDDEGRDHVSVSTPALRLRATPVAAGGVQVRRRCATARVGVPQRGRVLVADAHAGRVVAGLQLKTTCRPRWTSTWSAAGARSSWWARSRSTTTGVIGGLTVPARRGGHPACS